MISWQRRRWYAGAAGGIEPVGWQVLLAPLVLGALLGAGGSAAQGTGQASSEPPPIPARRDLTGHDLVASMRSDVRIVDRGNHQITEHAAGGNVYMIEVKPDNAPPYYLYDDDGSGNFQWRRGVDVERTRVPHWAIVRW